MGFTVEDLIDQFDIADDAVVQILSAEVLGTDPDCLFEEVFQKAELAKCKGETIKRGGPLYPVIKDTPVRHIYAGTDGTLDYAILLEGTYRKLQRSIVSALETYLDQEYETGNHPSDAICF